ncbi:MAG TPA: methyltransferase domain-containing protein [Candidatus Limnocylindrales bacterium]
MDAAIEGARALFVGAQGERASLLARLFRFEATVAAPHARQVLGDASLNDLVATGLARVADGQVAAQVRLVRFRGALIASDRFGYRRHTEFVIGPGPASALLADAVRPLERGRVLDLGCGPGSQALWLASGDTDVLGIDISERALAFASFNQRLNGRDRATFVYGDFLTAPPDPALDERFDVALANPPFVLTPTTELRYRDRPLPGDATTRTALERVARALAPGGRGYVLGTWIDAGRGAWDARPRGWLHGLDVRAAIARISSLDPAAYAVAWSRDLEEPARSASIAAWSRALEAEGAARITTGILAIAGPARSSWRRRGQIVALDRVRPLWATFERALAG